MGSALPLITKKHQSKGVKGENMKKRFIQNSNNVKKRKGGKGIHPNPKLKPRF
jgi:hypothetical protein